MSSHSVGDQPTPIPPSSMNNTIATFLSKRCSTHSDAHAPPADVFVCIGRSLVMQGGCEALGLGGGGAGLGTWQLSGGSRLACETTDPRSLLKPGFCRAQVRSLGLSALGRYCRKTVKGGTRCEHTDGTGSGRTGAGAPSHAPGVWQPRLGWQGLSTNSVTLCYGYSITRGYSRPSQPHTRSCCRPRLPPRTVAGEGRVAESQAGRIGREAATG